MIPVLAIAFAVTALACAALRPIAFRAGMVVYPRGDRWHDRARPLLGGVGIIAGVAVAAWFTRMLDAPALAVGAGALLMGVVGLVDDRVSLSPLAKLVTSLASGALIVYALVAVLDLAPPSWLMLLAIVWFGGICHALNLLDNMDGLAAGTGAIAAFVLAGIAGLDGQAGIAALLVALAGALLGFLLWNVHPARMFMGDCGSLFIGAILAGATLPPVLGPGPRRIEHAIVAALALAAPLFDTAFVLVLRRLAGRSATRGGTDHVSHRLVSTGFSQPRAVAGIWAIGACGGLLAWWMHRAGLAAALPIAALFAAALTLLGVYLARVPAYGGDDFAALDRTRFAPLVRDLTFRWHTFEVLLDAVLIAACYYVSYRVRFEDETLDVFMPSFTASLPMVVACKLAALYVSGLYSRVWGTFGIGDVSTAVRGVALGSILSVLGVAYVYRFERFSRGVFVIDAVLLLMAILATRLSFRVLARAAVTRRAGSRRVLVYGAGAQGQLLVREMLANPSWQMNPVGFVDDAPVKQHRRLLGVAVRGGIDDLERLVERVRADEVIISTAAVDEALEARVRAICERRGISVRRLVFEIR